MLQSLRIKYKNMLYSDNKKWGRVFFVYNKMYKGMPEVLAKKERVVNDAASIIPLHRLQPQENDQQKENGSYELPTQRFESLI